MAYMHFTKTEIASYTDVAALLCVTQNTDFSTALWKYQLYGNLCWEYKTNTLYHCGKYEHFSYREFEYEDRIILHKLPKNSSYIEIKKYIDKGFFVMFPINTKTLGHTEREFKHNVFVTGYEDDDFIVYDFWAPHFNWKYMKVDCKHLFESVDFSNDETVQSFYVFKYNESYLSEDIFVPDLEQLRSLFTIIWHDTKNEQYDNQKNAHGVSAYRAMYDYFCSVDRLAIADCQNFHVLFDHLNFTENCLNRLFGENALIREVVSVYKDLVKRAYRMRMLVYKHYIAKKDMTDIRVFVSEEVRSIGEIEQMQRRRLVASNGGVDYVVG